MDTSIVGMLVNRMDPMFSSPHLRPHRMPRPLPLIPHPLACKSCRSCITSTDVIFPPSSIPLSRGFKGFAGKASLFTEIYNVVLDRPSVRLMSSGAHTMQEITCATCRSYLGWKIVRAHNRSERWKEGHCLLELENLYAGSQEAMLLRAALQSISELTSSPDDSG